jgi:predicted PurR-regulated permease PerM
MDEIYFRKITTILILGVLTVLSFFLLKSILLSIIAGFILAFIFSPIHNWLYKLTKLKNLPAILICIALLIAIILPLWFLTPALIDESIRLYRASQNLDIITPLKSLFPSFFASNEFSQEIASTIQSFITNITNSLMNYFSQIILDFPIILLQLFVVFFTFFYVLRDKDQLILYIKSLLPFSKEIEKKLFDSTRDITFSILYGQIITGIIQGIILGAGFFIFGVPNSFLLSILAVIAGVLPIVGPISVGVPVAIFLLVGGNSFAAFGVILFATVASFSYHFFQPLFVSKRTQLHTVLILIGMIGGFLLFGILGFILGPLILAYLIIIIETYRNKSLPAVLIQEPD